jgi:hypothetical protein
MSRGGGCQVNDTSGDGEQRFWADVRVCPLPIRVPDLSQVPRVSVATVRNSLTPAGTRLSRPSPDVIRSIAELRYCLRST